MHRHLHAARYTAKPPEYLRSPDLIYELYKAKGEEGRALLPLQRSGYTRRGAARGEGGAPDFPGQVKRRNDLTEIRSQAPGDVDQISQKTGPKWRMLSCSHRVVMLLGFVQACCHILRICLWHLVCAKLRAFYFVVHFCDSTVDCSGGCEIHNLLPLQTVPHL